MFRCRDFARFIKNPCNYFHVQCANVPGSYSCSGCETGFVLLRGQCVPIGSSSATINLIIRDANTGRLANTSIRIDVYNGTVTFVSRIGLVATSYTFGAYATIRLAPGNYTVFGYPKFQNRAPGAVAINVKAGDYKLLTLFYFSSLYQPGDDKRYYQIAMNPRNLLKHVDLKFRAHTSFRACDGCECTGCGCAYPDPQNSSWPCNRYDGSTGVEIYNPGQRQYEVLQSFGMDVFGLRAATIAEAGYYNYLVFVEGPGTNSFFENDISVYFFPASRNPATVFTLDYNRNPPRANNVWVVACMKNVFGDASLTEVKDPITNKSVVLVISDSNRYEVNYSIYCK